MAGAINLAILRGADIISMSWGSNKYSSELSSSLEAIFSSQSNSRVTFIASLGDTGGVVSYPGCSPNVLCIGGSNLAINSSTNAYIAKAAWWGSGGGATKYVTAPLYQTNNGNNKLDIY